MSERKPPARGPVPPRCTGKRADGKPCAGAPLAGTTRCWHHSFRVPGRPSKLTPELTERILDAVLEGNYLETAAQIVGVNRRTLYRWLERAERAEADAWARAEEQDADLNAADANGIYDYAPSDDWPYLDFRHALKSAEAHAEAELLRMVRTGFRGWQAPMTVLERRHPDRWRRREGITLDGELNTGRPELVEPRDDEVRQAIAEALVAAGAVDPPKPKQPRKRR